MLEYTTWGLIIEISKWRKETHPESQKYKGAFLTNSWGSSPPLFAVCPTLYLHSIVTYFCQAWMEQNKEQVIVYKWDIDLRLEGVQYRMLAVRLVRLKASRNPILIQLACVFNSRLPLVLTPFTAVWKQHKIIASRKKEEQQMLSFKPPKCSHNNANNNHHNILVPSSWSSRRWEKLLTWHSKSSNTRGMHRGHKKQV
jgi:hypothetical protein